MPREDRLDRRAPPFPRFKFCQPPNSPKKTGPPGRGSIDPIFSSRTLWQLPSTLLHHLSREDPPDSLRFPLLDDLGDLNSKIAPNRPTCNCNPKGWPAAFQPRLTSPRGLESCLPPADSLSPSLWAIWISKSLQISLVATAHLTSKPTASSLPASPHKGHRDCLAACRVQIPSPHLFVLFEFQSRTKSPQLEPQPNKLAKNLPTAI